MDFVSSLPGNVDTYAGGVPKENGDGDCDIMHAKKLMVVQSGLDRLAPDVSAFLLSLEHVGCGYVSS